MGVPGPSANLSFSSCSRYRSSPTSWCCPASGPRSCCYSMARSQLSCTGGAGQLLPRNCIPRGTIRQFWTMSRRHRATLWLLCASGACTPTAFQEKDGADREAALKMNSRVNGREKGRGEGRVGRDRLVLASCVYVVWRQRGVRYCMPRSKMAKQRMQTQSALLSRCRAGGRRRLTEM